MTNPHTSASRRFAAAVATATTTLAVRVADTAAVGTRIPRIPLPSGRRANPSPFFNEEDLPMSAHSRIVALALSTLALASGSVSAMDTAFNGIGIVNTGPAAVPPPGAPVGQFFSLVATHVPGMGYTLNGQIGWSFESVFTAVVEPSPADPMQPGAITGWISSVTFTLGADSLFGFGSVHSPDVQTTPLSVNYTFTGGTGVFTGHSGTGSSLVQLLGAPVPGVGYIESNGQIALVPEPASALMLACGGAALLRLRSRRGARSSTPTSRRWTCPTASPTR